MSTAPRTSLVSEDDAIDGHQRKSIRMNNDALERVRALNDPLSTLHAETRWLVLQLSRKDYAEAVGINHQASMNMERPAGRPEHATYVRVHDFWSVKEEITDDAREQLLTLIVKKLKEQKHGAGAEETGDAAEDAETPFELSTVDLYRKWSVITGMDAFDAAAVRIGECAYHSLWQREANQMIPDFGKVHALARKLKQDRDEAADVWSRDKMAQLCERGVEEPLCQLIVALQTHNPASPFTLKDLQRTYGITQRAADTLVQHGLPPFAEIEDAARMVISKKEWSAFTQAWHEAEEALSARDSFEKALLRTRDERGVTNRMLSIALDIKAPETRSGENVDDDRRKEPFRPSADIRRSVSESEFSRSAPAGALIDLVAGTPEEREYLRNLFFARISERARRTGNAANLSPMRQRRCLWGVDTDELKHLGLKRKDVLDIESGRKTLDGQELIIEAVEQMGLVKVQSARERWAELLRPPRSVSDVVTIVSRRVGGRIPLNAKLKEKVTAVHEGISPEHLKRIETGEVVPPLPTILRIWEHGDDIDIEQACDAVLSAAANTVIMDWYAKYPDFLTQSPKSPWHTPLTRFFGLLIGERSTSIAAFCTENMPDLDHASMSRDFHDINKGKMLTWRHLSRYLDAAELHDGPRRRYIEILYDEHGDLSSAVRHWRREVRRANKNPADYEHLLGWTSEERERLS